MLCLRGTVSRIACAYAHALTCAALTLALMLVSLGADAQQKSADDVTVYFRVSDSFIDPAYLDNARSLERLDSLVSLYGNGIDSIACVSYASPEGPNPGNILISQERADAVSAYLAARWPAVSVGPVSAHSAGPDYAGLIDLILADKNIPYRDDVLDLLGQMEVNAPRAMYLIKCLHDRVPYAYIRDNHLPWLRRARLIIYYSSVPLSSSADVQAEKDSSMINTHVILPDNIPCSDVQDVPKEKVRAEERKPVIAVSSNVLVLGGAAFTDFRAIPLNIGLELPLGKHWSLFADYTATVPWRPWNNNANCAQLVQGYLGARWYPGNRGLLGGWYLYAQAGAGYYDFEQSGKGYQGEEILGTLGVGYSFVLGDHLRLNLGVGGGPIFTGYRYYEGRSSNQYLMYRYSGNWQYWGVTDTRVGLTWIFYHKKK